jgi:4-alpha-glucanotransferase
LTPSKHAPFVTRSRRIIPRLHQTREGRRATDPAPFFACARSKRSDWRAIPALARFAAFELLRRRYRGPWWEWPAAWRNPDLHRLAEMQAAEAEEVGFFTFVQWIADQQLARCCEEARTLKLPIGLYLDIAVGVRPDGFDAWSDQGAILPRLSVGAPPDPINTAGQNWGLGCRSAGRSHAASSIG